MRVCTGLGLLALCACAGSANAIIVDLTTANASGTINGALFQNFNIQPAGSGNLNSFVRISSNTNTVQGYNTSGRPTAFNENSSPTFTRDLTFGELPSKTINGVEYKEFLLDINQTNADPLLTLNQVLIFSSATGSQITPNVYSLGTVVYEMNVGVGPNDPNGANRVELNYSLQAGSGQADMYMYVPLSAFGAIGNSQFIYLYSKFGDPNNNNDGYEEWAVRGGEIIPLPPAVWAGGASLAGMVLVRRIRRRAS